MEYLKKELKGNYSSPLKKGEVKLISLDYNYTNEYNYNNDTINITQIDHLNSKGKILAIRGSALKLNPYGYSNRNNLNF